MNTSKILDIVCTVCIVIITILCIIVTWYILKPEKVIVQKWTSSEGKSYLISDYPMIPLDD